MPSTARVFDSLSHEQSVALLDRAQVGRVVFTVGALPAIVPVTFAVQDDAIVICTAEQSRLALAADGHVLAFEVDELDVVTHTGWSVVVTGVAEIVTDPVERALLQGVVVPWVPGQRDTFIRVPFTMLTGRRIVDPTVAAAAEGTSPG